MKKEFLSILFRFIISITILCGIHYIIVKQFIKIEIPSVIPKIYLILGLMNLIILQVGCFVKIKKSEYVGFVFLGGIIFKMALAITLVILSSQIKSNIIQFLIGYLIVLFIELLVFVRLININLEEV